MKEFFSLTMFKVFLIKFFLLLPVLELNASIRLPRKGNSDAAIMEKVEQTLQRTSAAVEEAIGIASKSLMVVNKTTIEIKNMSESSGKEHLKKSMENARNLSESASRASEEASKLMIDAKQTFYANGTPSMPTAYKSMEKVKEATNSARKAIKDAKAAAKISLENLYELKGNSSDSTGQNMDSLMRADNWIIKVADNFKELVNKLKELIDDTLKTIQESIDNLVSKLKTAKPS